MENSVVIENKSLVLDLLEWVIRRRRTYAEVMDAWRTSCPRLPIWEDTVDLGLIVCERHGSSGVFVTATPAGHALLAAERPQQVSRQRAASA